VSLAKYRPLSRGWEKCRRVAAKPGNMQSRNQREGREANLELVKHEGPVLSIGYYSYITVH